MFSQRVGKAVCMVTAGCELKCYAIDLSTLMWLCAHLNEFIWPADSSPKRPSVNINLTFSNKNAQCPLERIENRCDLVTNVMVPRCEHYITNVLRQFSPKCRHLVDSTYRFSCHFRPAGGPRFPFQRPTVCAICSVLGRSCAATLSGGGGGALLTFAGVVHDREKPRVPWKVVFRRF